MLQDAKKAEAKKKAAQTQKVRVLGDSTFGVGPPGVGKSQEYCVALL